MSITPQFKRRKEKMKRVLKKKIPGLNQSDLGNMMKSLKGTQISSLGNMVHIIQFTIIGNGRKATFRKTNRLSIRNTESVVGNLDWGGVVEFSLFPEDTSSTV